MLLTSEQLAARMRREPRWSRTGVGSSGRWAQRCGWSKPFCQVARWDTNLPKSRQISV